MSRACNVAIVLLGLLCAAAIFWVFPFTTQDGPVHVAFGNFLILDRDAHPLLFQHYRANNTLNPNSFVYVPISLLLTAFSPALTESLVQVFCTLGVVTSAWFALRQISAGSDTTWLTLLVFPMALSRLFFYGLYNFCFSVAGFFLVIGSFLRLQRSVTLWRVLAVVSALYFAFLAHAGGFLAAVLAISVLILVQAVRSLRARESLSAIIRAQRINLLVLVSPLPLVLLALSSSVNAPASYGTALERRVVRLALLEPLAVHEGPGKEVAILLLSPVLFGGVVALAIGVWRRRGHLSHVSQRADAIGALAMFVALVMLALSFPDKLGGGWIHFQRMALFPYLGAVLCLAYCPIPKRVQAAIASVAAIVTVALLTDTVTVQLEIDRQMRPLAEVDRIVGSHCSVLPLVLSNKPLDERDRAVGLIYRPYLHAATLLELGGDRVSLYNYQARTVIYPVRFQERHDTQDLIFHWRPNQEGAGIQTVDIERFEASSGMPVDYILQWGPLNAATPELRQQVVLAEQGARRVYESQDGRVALFRRPTHARSHCSG
jgi:hypothetical protein